MAQGPFDQIVPRSCSPCRAIYLSTYPVGISLAVQGSDVRDQPNPLPEAEW
jgi:hypothetical protein